MKYTQAPDFWKDKIVVVDFDGTCVTHAYPAVGRDIGASPVLRRLQDEGAKIILNTIRSGQRLTDAVNWFSDNGILLWGINRNPQQGEWSDSPKVYAHLYIDDAALGAPLGMVTDSARPIILWDEVSKMLWPNDCAYHCAVQAQAMGDAGVFKTS